MIVLASKSPRRRELLGMLGLEFTLASPNADETLPEGISPREGVEELSRRKALSLSGEYPNDLIIAADTLVAVDGRCLGKPRDPSEARRMLSELSGRSHEVFTGLTICLGERIVTKSERTEVIFRALSDEEIEAYVSSGEPMDKAGAYGIQSKGSLLVEGIRGDYFNVVGLPVCTLGLMLKEFGIEIL